MRLRRVIRPAEEGEEAGGDLNAAITRLQGTLASLDDPADAEALRRLLGALYDAGRRDLPLGRLFEGHIDALQIICRYGRPDIADDARRRAKLGATFGVWNADLPGEPLTLDHGRLHGGKSFASGAGLLSHALVTADTARGRQLLLIDLGDLRPAIDRDWWHVVGMARSLTHIVRWRDAPVASSALIGEPGDYAREPWFSGGALRFVAVHAGGIAAILDHARAHLVAAGRAGDPFQAARLAELFACADLAAAAVRNAAARWFDEADAVRLPRVAAARMQVAEMARRAIGAAQDAVGVQALFRTHPLAAALTDLMVYIRQPAPDAQLLRVAEAVADERLVARF